MRLINVHTRSFEEFFDETAPKYAILSHTWESGEVLYQEYLATEYDQASQQYRSDKAGFQKISYTCAQAQKDGHSHAWIDTCCIDKSSSAELTKAINSMYAWYENAEVCYAYIADLCRSDVLSGSEPKHKIDMSRVRWLTRGWTLQEMLAPRHVRFYCREWIWFGSRSSLADSISAVTRIERNVLIREHFLLVQTYDVAERMSWATGRQTSEEEDIAYSLLDLFQVNMPLIYGEGRSAFRRMQEEIIRTNDDQSIFTWETKDALESHLLLAESPDRFRDYSARRLLRNEPHHAGFSMNNIALEITVPMLRSKWPGYHLARLSVGRDDTAGRGQLHYGYLWLHDLHGVGNLTNFYAAAPFDCRLTYEPDVHMDPGGTQEELRTIRILHNFPWHPPIGSPLGHAHESSCTPLRARYRVEIDAAASFVGSWSYDQKQRFPVYDLTNSIFPFAAVSFCCPAESSQILTVVFGEVCVSADDALDSVGVFGVLGIFPSHGPIQHDTLKAVSNIYKLR